MDPSTSKLLDAMRFTAAVVVLLFHATSRDFNLVLPWVRWGHEAVVAFFVMSGFVIAYITTAKETSITQYTAARLARLYSVVLPALVLTAVLDAYGRTSAPDLYKSIPSDNAVLRLLVNGLFIQQIGI